MSIQIFLFDNSEPHLNSRVSSWLVHTTNHQSAFFGGLSAPGKPLLGKDKEFTLSLQMMTLSKSKTQMEVCIVLMHFYNDYFFIHQFQISLLHSKSVQLVSRQRRGRPCHTLITAALSVGRTYHCYYSNSILQRETDRQF